MGDIKIGNSNITLKLGSSDVAAAYIGSVQVYGGSTPPTPTGYTYSVTITGLENGDTTDIHWDGGSYIDCGVGNGTYTYTSANDSIGVDISSVQDYSVDYGSFQLYDYDPSITVTFTYQGGGGGFTHIPQGTDMSQYYNQTITRFKIGDSSLPSGYQQVNLAFQTGGSGSISTWSACFAFDNTYVTSLPCDVSGSDSLTQWNCFDSSWGMSSNNPFTDLWIEFA